MVLRFISDVEAPKRQNSLASPTIFKKNRNPERKPTGNPLSFFKGASAKQVKTDELSPDDIIIAVMGPTGSGKSSFINVITGLETGVGHNLESCTSKVSNVRLSVPEMAFGDLVFVDTPGFDDTHKSDVDILKMVADWLKSTYEKDILLSGLLYFHRISDNRMAGTPLKNLRMFEELCGKSAFQNVILTTTMWDEVDLETGEEREAELKSKYWRTMLERNSTTSRFLRTRESAFRLIDPLIDAANKRSSLLLQDELVDMRKKLPSTSAGQELFSAMEVLVRQREDLLRRIRNEMKRTDGDKVTLEPLQEEHQKLQMTLEETVNEMRRLKLPLGQRLMNMTDKFFSSKLKSFKSIFKRLSKADQPDIDDPHTTPTIDSPVSVLPSKHPESEEHPPQAEHQPIKDPIAALTHQLGVSTPPSTSHTPSRDDFNVSVVDGERPELIRSESPAPLSAWVELAAYPSVPVDKKPYLNDRNLPDDSIGLVGDEKRVKGPEHTRSESKATFSNASNVLVVDGQRPEPIRSKSQAHSSLSTTNKYSQDDAVSKNPNHKKTTMSQVQLAVADPPLPPLPAYTYPSQERDLPPVPPCASS